MSYYSPHLRKAQGSGHRDQRLRSVPTAVEPSHVCRRRFVDTVSLNGTSNANVATWMLNRRKGNVTHVKVGAMPRCTYIKRKIYIIQGFSTKTT